MKPYYIFNKKFMEENKKVSEITDKLWNICDAIVKPIYSENLVKKVEELPFMKSLMESGFVKAIEDFWKWWFKWVFVFFWWLAIILWPIAMIMFIFEITKYSSVPYLIYNILQIVASFLTFLLWVSMVKFKKYYPFLVIISLIMNIINYLFMAYINVAYNPLITFWAVIVSTIIGLAIGLGLFAVAFAIILRNKSLFKN